MKIGIIVGSVREGRGGRGIADWVYEVATKRNDATFELIDLKEFDVPLLTTNTHPMMAKKSYDSDAVTAWSKAIDACDAFIFVSPEYNHGVPGALKNAFDSLGPEWVGKAVAFVGYGAVGGVRAIENWRTVLANFQMVVVRAELNVNTFTDFNDGEFAPIDRRENELNELFQQLITATRRQRFHRNFHQ